MSLARFQACIAGYEDHLFDLQILAVHSGYWSGYYSNAKKPKSLSSIVQKMLNSRMKAANKASRKHSDEVDVAAFMEAERRFKARLSNKGSE